MPFTRLRSIPSLARAARVLLAVCVLAVAHWLAPGAVRAHVMAGSAAAPGVALSNAERDLAATRKRRVAACRHRRTSACRRLKAAERRQSARVARLRRLAKAERSIAPDSTVWHPAAAAAVEPPAPATPESPSAPAPGAELVPTATPVPTATASPAPTATTTPAPSAETLYVAPHGRNAGAATVSDPLATLTEALARAEGGEQIVVAAGSYPAAVDQRARTETVTVTGPGDGSASVAGMQIAGGQKLEIRGLSFTNLVTVVYHSSRRLAQPARDIDFRDDDFTAPSASGCITARNGVQNVSITNSHVHDCVTGFGAGAGGAIPQSRGLVLAGNRFERFTGDAIQFGQWDDVEITGNVIDSIRDPSNTIHNDGIQLTGNSRLVTIAGNRITNSRTQLIFIQDAVGPIEDITVEGNLVYGAGAVAVQSQGATRARFVNNTVWRGKDGGLWLTQGYTRAGEAVSIPRDAVVTDNVLQSYRRIGGAATATASGNVGLCLPWELPSTDAASGWTCMNDLGFVDAAHDDYTLAVDSPVRALGRAVAPGALG